MRGHEYPELRGETLPTPLPPIPDRLKQHRALATSIELPVVELDPNGTVGCDSSGLDQEFYEPTTG